MENVSMVIAGSITGISYIEKEYKMSMDLLLEQLGVMLVSSGRMLILTPVTDGFDATLAGTKPGQTETFHGATLIIVLEQLIKPAARTVSGASTII